jgi:predicted DCC family thiol-disulfide oxidoreductase YuxK
LIGGRALFKSDAAIAVLSRLPGFGWTRLLRFVPRKRRDLAYDRIARNRYAWFGRAEACILPGPALRGRVLETADALGPAP